MPVSEFGSRCHFDEDIPTVTQVKNKQVHERPITRSRAKLLKKEMNSFLFETNFNIHDNIIRFTPCQLIENTLFYQSTCMGVGSVINERD